MDLPKILIIIVTWNKESYVLNLLKSLEGLHYPQDRLDILLIDNASQDNTVSLVSEQFPDVRIVCNEQNLGGTGGFNTGLTWAFEQPDGAYDYLWLLDNDVVVNRHALLELVKLLEQHRDAAVAGSTMMQLDYPWRVNEVGSYYSKKNGGLIFNFHGLPIEPWKGRPMDELLASELDISDYIPDFKSYIDVDYVAAASLLVRADVAKAAGIWDDFFIHFDDVQWCLRIAKKGHRILASCRSLIWHISSAAKVPTWVLYYDSRNMLQVMKQFGEEGKLFKSAVNRELKKAVYYALIGRMELARLVIQAVDDFFNGVLGKQSIQLPPAQNHLKQELEELPFMDPDIQRVLVPWTVNLYATGLQELLVKACHVRPDLQIDFLTAPGGLEIHQFPSSQFISFPVKRLSRYLTYRHLRNRYDLVLQSEYDRIIGLSWLGSRVMFLSNSEYCLRPPNRATTTLRFIAGNLFKRWRLPTLFEKVRSRFISRNVAIS